MDDIYSLLTTVAAAVDISPLPKVTADNARLRVILSVFFGLLGAASFVVLVMAGLRYITSNGDPNTMTKARNIIIYASIGLVLAMLAFTIVEFVLTRL
ncbi:MAG TPA: pilin [Candidatus Saccharimonadales bacterium]|nr:pilin [Candidatus Saccharimonadales bacterium]